MPTSDKGHTPNREAIRPSKLSSSLTLERSWLLGSRAFEYQLGTPLEPGALSDLIEACFRWVILKALGLPQRQALPDDVRVVDVKGRDASNVIDSSIPAGDLPRQHEVFFLSGVTFHSNAQKHPLEERRFNWSLTTPFLEFGGGNSIIHQALLEQHGDLPHDILLDDLGRVFPLRPDRFRLGLDFYGNHRLSSWLPLVPSVSQTLLLEADAQRCLVRISSEDLRAWDRLPLAKPGVFEGLCQALSTAAHFDLQRDITSKRSIGKGL